MAVRDVWLVAGLAGLALSAPAAAQEAKPFVPEFNTEGHPVLPADKLVPATALGYLEPFRGRAWWQALMFCAGAWENQATKAEDAKDQARSDALSEESNARFFRPALRRLMADRGIGAEDAQEILRPEVSLQYLVAADTERPFADDQPRCRVIQAAHAVVDRQAAARAAGAD